MDRFQKLKIEGELLMFLSDLFRKHNITTLDACQLLTDALKLHVDILVKSKGS